MDYKKLHEETLAALQKMVFDGKITEETARSICSDFIKESCEYVFKVVGYKGFLAHKGNCRFCKERRQKELEELLIKLKEK